MSTIELILLWVLIFVIGLFVGYLDASKDLRKLRRAYWRVRNQLTFAEDVVNAQRNEIKELKEKLPKTTRDKIFIISAYKDRQSINNIANAVWVDPSTIRKALKRRGIIK